MTSVEVLRSNRAGGLDVVRVRGVVTSGNWGQPHLIPITRGEGRDGMLDLVFQASAPTGAQALGPFMTVEAILPVETGHPLQGHPRARRHQCGLAEGDPGLYRDRPLPRKIAPSA